MELLGRQVGNGAPLFVIAGPCVIESETLAMEAAETLANIGARLNLLLIYKSSFDKANRTSGTSFRGPGIDEGLRILEKVRAETGLPILTDVHDTIHARAAADVVDILQTPAFLARQTDFIRHVTSLGKPVNIKKAQFMAPGDMAHVVAKCGDAPVMVCERGTTFGYGNLVVDMRGLAIMGRIGVPVVFDATHSVQLPGAGDGRSGGEREFVPVLAQAAVAAGVDGVFLETHPRPDEALCDGPNAWPLDRLEPLLAKLQILHDIARAKSF